MRHRTSHLGRRSFALALAYLLALQVILTAWVVLAPAAASALGLQTVICTSHPNGSAPNSDLPPTQCPCGPMCHACAAPMPGTPPEVISVVIAHLPAAAVVWHAQRRGVAPAVSASPHQARAPPVTA
jgi:hypothetical protein